MIFAGILAVFALGFLYMLFQMTAEKGLLGLIWGIAFFSAFFGGLASIFGLATMSMYRERGGSGYGEFTATSILICIAGIIVSAILAHRDRYEPDPNAPTFKERMRIAKRYLIKPRETRIPVRVKQNALKEAFSKSQIISTPARDFYSVFDEDVSKLPSVVINAMTAHLNKVDPHYKRCGIETFRYREHSEILFGLLIQNDSQYWIFHKNTTSDGRQTTYTLESFDEPAHAADAFLRVRNKFASM
jgi:predicted lipid-binding transport protein (Tim44 family)